MTPSNRRPEAPRAKTLVAVALATAVAGLGIVACSSDEVVEGDAATGPATPVSDVSPTGQADAFPRTVEHALGETEIPAAPETIVTMGAYQDLDAVLALGLTPTAYGYLPYVTADLPPWSADAAAGAERLGTDEAGLVSIEEVATYRPDLLVGISGFLADTYGSVSGSIPTVTLEGSADWRSDFLVVAEATGREAEAEEVLADVDVDVAAAADELSGADVTTIAVVNKYFGSIGVPGPADGQSVVVEALGLELLDVGVDGTETEFSEERLAELDAADVILVEDFIAEETDELLASPLFAGLTAVEEGRVARLSPAATRAGYLLSPLSFPYAADAYAESIAAAAEGAGSLDPVP